MDSVEIPLSKAKLLPQFLATVVLLATSLFVVWIHAVDPLANNYFQITLGVLGAFIVLPMAAFTLFKLLDGRPGLIIDDEGIIDNSSFLSLGRIHRKDIVGTGRSRNELSMRYWSVNLKKHFFIHVFVSNPEAYALKPHGLKRTILKSRVRSGQTPIILTTNTLQTNSEKLEAVLLQRFFTK